MSCGENVVFVLRTTQELNELYGQKVECVNAWL